jgi:Zn-dependent protease
MHVLATADFSNPLFWSVMVAWIGTVTVHEFSHGLVAYLGGDYTIRQRGGLALNPLHYINLQTSILIPLAMLAMGGIPLPGGATYIRRDLLRSRAWESLVAAAGPASNLIMGALFFLPLHPAFKWAYTNPDDIDHWSNFQMFLATMGVLQWMTALFNLIPCPPLDGFNIISPMLPDEVRQSVRSPQVQTGLFIGLFIVLMTLPGVTTWMFDKLAEILLWCHFDYFTLDFIRRSFNYTLLGHSD